MQKMNVITKISGVFTLKLHKKYLNMVIYNTPVLLWIKKLNSLIYRSYSMSTYTRVTNF